MDEKQKIRRFLSKFIKVDELADDDNIFEKGLVNSLFAMQLVNFVEKEFEITIANDQLDLANFKDVNTIAWLIKSNC